MKHPLNGTALAGAMLASVLFTAPMALAGGLGEVATTQAQPSDDTLKDRINYRLESNDLVHKYDIKVKVDGGIATLSGDVANAAQKAEAERIAKVDGVSRVESNIAVNANADKTVADRMKSGMSRTGEKISDAWITTKVNWFFVGEDALKGSDINVDTKDNVVTLKGHVPSQAGRARALELAKRTDGVKNVVDQLVVRTTAQ